MPTATFYMRFNVSSGPIRGNFLVEYRHIGPRVPTQSNLSLDGTADMRRPSYNLEAYDVVDLAVGTTPISLGDQSTFTALARVTNVLDSGFTEIGFNGVDVPTVGRTAWLQADVKF